MATIFPKVASSKIANWLNIFSVQLNMLLLQAVHKATVAHIVSCYCHINTHNKECSHISLEKLSASKSKGHRSKQGFMSSAVNIFTLAPEPSDCGTSAGGAYCRVVSVFVSTTPTARDDFFSLGFHGDQLCGEETKPGAASR